MGEKGRNVLCQKKDGKAVKPSQGALKKEGGGEGSPVLKEIEQKKKKGKASKNLYPLRL